MDSNELLEMKLNDVSDLLLERLCESGEDAIKFDLPGCNVKTRERFVLRVCLIKSEVKQ